MCFISFWRALFGISALQNYVQHISSTYQLFASEQSVSKYSRGVHAADGSGPPPWVAFGKRIVKNFTELQKFKALKDPEGKEKVDGEFENQRKQVVKELSKEANLKASSFIRVLHYLLNFFQ